MDLNSKYLVTPVWINNFTSSPLAIKNLGMRSTFQSRPRPYLSPGFSCLNLEKSSSNGVIEAGTEKEKFYGCWKVVVVAAVAINWAITGGRAGVVRWQKSNPTQSKPRGQREYCESTDRNSLFTCIASIIRISVNVKNFFSTNAEHSAQNAFLQSRSQHNCIIFFIHVGLMMILIRFKRLKLYFSCKIRNF